MPDRSSDPRSLQMPVRMVVVLVLLVALPAPASGATAERLDARLPAGGPSMAAASLDGTVYAFGGLCDCKNVTRFDPANGTVTELDAPIPFEGDQVFGMAAVATGDAIHLFGGFTFEQTEAGRGEVAPRPEVLRFDPATETVTRTGIETPARGFWPGVQVGSDVYLLGGSALNDEGGSLFERSAEIVMVDLEAGEAVTLDERLPEPRSRSNVVEVNGTIHVVGGRMPHAPTASVLTYTPGEGNATATNATLALPRSGAAGAVVDDRLYVFGGGDGEQRLSSIEGYDPVEQRTWVSEAILPSPRDLAAGTGAGEAAYVLGGQGEDATPIPEIVRFQPDDEPPPPSSGSEDGSQDEGGHVDEDRPEARFTVQQDGLDVQVDASRSVVANGSEASYTWSFGDGSPIASGVQAEHTYAEAGTYTISLTVEDDRGRSDTTERTVTVQPGRATSNTSDGDAASGSNASEPPSHTDGDAAGTDETGSDAATEDEDGASIPGPGSLLAAAVALGVARLRRGV